MKPIAINLREPFETVLATVLQLPPGAGMALADDKQIIKAVRRLYEAAHGRSVQTPIGLIPIAPAIASSLAAEPFYVSSRAELLSLVKRPIVLMRGDKRKFRRCQLSRPPRLVRSVRSSGPWAVVSTRRQTSPGSAARSKMPSETKHPAAAIK
jgi:hypothetical protein